MGFGDIFKSSFLDSVTQFSILDTILALVTALFIGLFIFVVYKKTLTGVMYSSGFALTLVGLSLVTTLVIMAVTSNVVLSLGMVGALSIVRFRTAVKDPLDLVFLFWSIAVGIICGAGFYNIAAIVSIIITIMIFVLDMIPVAKVPMILVVRAIYSDMQNEILDVVASESKYYKVKSRNIMNGQLNMIVELKTGNESELLDQIYGIEGVEYASLLDHDGEVTF